MFDCPTKNPIHFFNLCQINAIAVITNRHQFLKHKSYAMKFLLLGINCSILEFSDAPVTKILPFEDKTLSDYSNTLILSSTLDYIISAKRFDNSI